MSESERIAAAALAEALAAVHKAMLACGEAKLSFMNVVEPMLAAHESIAHTIKVVEGKV